MLPHVTTKTTILCTSLIFLYRSFHPSNKSECQYKLITAKFRPNHPKNKDKTYLPILWHMSSNKTSYGSLKRELESNHLFDRMRRRWLHRAFVCPGGNSPLKSLRWSSQWQASSLRSLGMHSLTPWPWGKSPLRSKSPTGYRWCCRHIQISPNSDHFLMLDMIATSVLCGGVRSLVNREFFRDSPLPGAMQSSPAFWVLYCMRRL